MTGMVSGLLKKKGLYIPQLMTLTSRQLNMADILHEINSVPLLENTYMTVVVQISPLTFSACGNGIPLDDLGAQYQSLLFQCLGIIHPLSYAPGNGYNSRFANDSRVPSIS